MSERPNADVLHYAACHDCSLYKWVDNQAQAEGAAARHYAEKGHDSTWGAIPSHMIEGTHPEPEREFNGE